MIDLFYIRLLYLERQNNDLGCVENKVKVFGGYTNIFGRRNKLEKEIRGRRVGGMEVVGLCKNRGGCIDGNILHASYIRQYTARIRFSPVLCIYLI